MRRVTVWNTVSVNEKGHRLGRSCRPKRWDTVYCRTVGHRGGSQLSSKPMSLFPQGMGVGAPDTEGSFLAAQLQSKDWIGRSNTDIRVDMKTMHIINRIPSKTFVNLGIIFNTKFEWRDGSLEKNYWAQLYTNRSSTSYVTVSRGWVSSGLYSCSIIMYYNYYVYYILMFFLLDVFGIMCFGIVSSHSKTPSHSTKSPLTVMYFMDGPVS